MMSVKVSIIVPVYNAEKTLSRCINSLLNQTYSNIEIVAVNDGSKDNSLELLKMYKRKIKIIDQKNSGPGVARNNGFLSATGDYVSFVDSDDELELDAIENMVKCLKKNTDVVISGFREYDVNGKIIINMIPKDELWTQFKFNSTMFKLYRRSFLIENNIKFVKAMVFEDLFFSLCAYSYTKNIEIFPNNQYIIYKNEDSITSNFHKRPLKSANEILEELYNKMNTKKYESNLLQFFYMKIIVLNLFTQLDGHKTKELNTMFYNDYNWLKNFKIGYNKIKFRWQKGENFSINLIINLFILSSKLRINYFLIALLKICKNVRVA